ncbi:hypothetical protein Lfu02_10670 [Longispora fulva]|uniref:Uncharacterized protein n=1 Tax=Longispora fulva TaxID=619741 RepID=A0A8J7G8U7_9ACTN|nr:hypothetical protein [Longispora fulva]MBG6135070.1 hypothetical protein [Longispora fulva]GIG56695.1 hypothetical protein Lfu02_10670 [Longispora fulva]
MHFSFASVLHLTHPSPVTARAERRPVADGFGFAFDPRWRLALAVAGVRPGTCAVTVGEFLRIRFGPWWLETPIDNVLDAAPVAVPAGWAGVGARAADEDTALFGTGPTRGASIRFVHPAAGNLPFGGLTHARTIVTVARVDELVAEINRPRG